MYWFPLGILANLDGHHWQASGADRGSSIFDPRTESDGLEENGIHSMLETCLNCVGCK